VGHTALTVQYVLSVPLGHVSFALTVQYVLSVLHWSCVLCIDCAIRAIGSTLVMCPLH
jgi:hypothetical protein